MEITGGDLNVFLGVGGSGESELKENIFAFIYF